jgi:flagellar basal-body rod protein FlgB
MTLFADGVTSSLQTALGALSYRQQVTSQNIANSATPGYHAKRVSFEDSLAAAQAAGADPMAATQVASYDAGTPADASGNTVAMDAETIDLQQESLQYSSVAQALTYKFSVMRAAIGNA